MNEPVILPDPVIQRLERLKTGPIETPADVISRLPDYYDDEDEVDEKTDQTIQKGLEDVDAGRHRPLCEIVIDLNPT